MRLQLALVVSELTAARPGGVYKTASPAALDPVGSAWGRPLPLPPVRCPPIAKQAFRLARCLSVCRHCYIQALPLAA